MAVIFDRECGRGTEQRNRIKAWSNYSRLAAYLLWFITRSFRYASRLHVCRSGFGRCVVIGPV